MTAPETPNATPQMPAESAPGATPIADRRAPRRESRRAPAPRPRVGLWVAAVLVVAAILVGAVLATRSPPPEKMELHLRIIPRDGTTAVTEKDTRSVLADIDITIGELGIERREVSPLGIGRLRVVLPDSVRARMPEIKQRLSDPRLRVTIEESTKRVE